MKNTGTPPEHHRVDIRFRNGRVKRGINPRQWRWKPWDWGESAYDIVDWQEAA